MVNYKGATLRQKKFFIYALMLPICCLTFAAFGLQPKPIELTAGLAKPPFVIENNKNNGGIQLDLIRAIFAVDNQQVNFVHVPLVRSSSSVDKWHFDGMITLPSDSKKKNTYISAPYISYQDVAVTLAEDHLSIDDIADLSGKDIIAFQMAKQFLGEEFANTLLQAHHYSEMADQAKQIEMLFAKDTQVLILDINILKYFLKNNDAEIYNKAYVVHALFPQMVYSAGFKNKLIRDQFNRGLNKIKDNGKYQQILDKYLL